MSDIRSNKNGKQQASRANRETSNSTTFLAKALKRFVIIIAQNVEINEELKYREQREYLFETALLPALKPVDITPLSDVVVAVSDRTIRDRLRSIILINAP
jgi:hypothetical protein